MSFTTLEQLGDLRRKVLARGGKAKNELIADIDNIILDVGNMQSWPKDYRKEQTLKALDEWTGEMIDDKEYYIIYDRHRTTPVKT